MGALSAIAEVLIKFFQKTGLFIFIIGGLAVLSFITNRLADKFDFLTSFFVIIRRAIMMFDFAFDTTTLLTILSYVLAIQVGVWAFRGYLVLAKFFNEK